MAIKKEKPEVDIKSTVGDLPIFTATSSDGNIAAVLLLSNNYSAIAVRSRVGNSYSTVAIVPLPDNLKAIAYTDIISLVVPSPDSIVLLLEGRSPVILEYTNEWDMAYPMTPVHIPDSNMCPNRKVEVALGLANVIISTATPYASEVIALMAWGLPKSAVNVEYYKRLLQPTRSCMSASIDTYGIPDVDAVMLMHRSLETSHTHVPSYWEYLAILERVKEHALYPPSYKQN